MPEGLQNLAQMERAQQSMLNFNNYFMRGVLTLKQKDGSKKPVYIAEYYTGGNANTERTVAVYRAVTVKLSDGSETYDKKYAMKDVVTKKFSDDGLLSRVAGALVKDNETHTKQKVYDIPLFVVPIEEGIDTFSQKRGWGFYEEAPSHYDVQSGDLERGNRTGVFITLDSFKWADANYRPEKVREALVDRYSN